MPIYPFVCTHCNYGEDKLLKISARDSEPTCPKCGNFWERMLTIPHCRINNGALDISIPKQTNHKPSDSEYSRNHGPQGCGIKIGPGCEDITIDNCKFNNMPTAIAAHESVKNLNASNIAATHCTVGFETYK